MSGLPPLRQSYSTPRLQDKISMIEELLISYARGFPFRKGKLRLVNAFWSVASREQDTMRMATLQYGGFKLPCDLREDLQRQFYFFGTYVLEEHILACWQKQVKAARVIFDVGANLGIYSFAALAVDPNVTVHAFEPTPEIATQLRTAAQRNGLSQLHVHETAVSSSGGYKKLNRYRGHTGTNGGMNFISGTVGVSDPDSVPTVDLDDFCKQNGIDHVDLMKVDVQGHEYDVLKGAEKLIRDGRIGLLLFELNWNWGQVCPARASIGLLEQYGYRFAAPKMELEWRQAGDWMLDLSDVFARRPTKDETACPA